MNTENELRQLYDKLIVYEIQADIFEAIVKNDPSFETISQLLKIPVEDCSQIIPLLATNSKLHCGRLKAEYDDLKEKSDDTKSQNNDEESVIPFFDNPFLHFILLLSGGFTSLYIGSIMSPTMGLVAKLSMMIPFVFVFYIIYVVFAAIIMVMLDD